MQDADAALRPPPDALLGQYFVVGVEMGRNDMIGVVLWTDPRQKTGVFWCEDQGELALYRNKKDACCADLCFEVGDLVTFEIETVERVRVASNPKVLKQGYYPDVPGVLRTHAAAETVSRRLKRRSANIVPLFQNANHTNKPIAECAVKTG